MNIHTYFRLHKIAAVNQLHPDTLRLVRRLLVAENTPVVGIPVNADHSLNLDGNDWYNSKYGRRTAIKGRWNSASGLGQITAPTYLELARKGRFPAKYLIGNPDKINEFYNLALSLRPEKQTSVGVQTMGAALKEWQRLYGENSIGEYGKYVLGLNGDAGVAHGADPGFSLDFHRDTYNAMVNEIDSRLKAVYAKYPGISQQEAWNRVAISWPYPGRLLAANYNTAPGSADYIAKFNSAQSTIDNYKPPTAQAATPVTVAPAAAKPKYTYQQARLDGTLWNYRKDKTFNPTGLPWGKFYKAVQDANPTLNFNKLPPKVMINLPHTRTVNK